MVVEDDMKLNVKMTENEDAVSDQLDANDQ